jgi:hypothetical protein
MTASEVRHAIIPLLRREPFVPVVVQLQTGERVFIDMPEQLEWLGDAILVVRRGEPKRKVEYDEIADVTPLDQVPAGPGMEYNEFQTTMRQFLRRQPFEPFVIELTDGRRLLAASRGGASFAGRFGFAFPPESGYVRFTCDQVARIASINKVQVG